MIRPYDPNDLDELLDAWYLASVLAHPFLSPEFLAQERRNIPDRYLPIAETWVYERDSHVVGFIAMIENEVGAIFVRPGLQSRGIGRALMDHVRASRDGLEVEVFEKNEIGRGFYDAYGFELVERRVHEDTGETLLRLRLAGKPTLEP